MSNEKAMIILLTIGLIKKISLYKMNYFPDSYSRSKNKIKVKLYLCNYSTKSDLKSAVGVNTSDFAKKVDLANL